MKRSINIQRTAHYYLQIPTKKVQSIIYVIHGYAQLADDFLINFAPLQLSSSLIVAPEGISKFYNKERKMVASWMTSQHREDEINDYINYLNDLHKTISSEYGELNTAVLGFSQGVSTCMRWITNSDISFREIHLCAGTIPPELTRISLPNQDKVSFFYYYGSRDKLLEIKKAKDQLAFLKQLNIDAQSIEFDGRHEISEITIKKLRHFSETSEK